MALAELPTTPAPELGGSVVAVREVRAAGREAVAKLREAERLRAEAAVLLAGFHDHAGPLLEGYLTSQRHLEIEARVSARTANQICRTARFVSDHPLVAARLSDGRLTVDHADVLARTGERVDSEEFSAALPDLLDAADGVDHTRFTDRIRCWEWRAQPDETFDDVEAAYERRSVTIQQGLFGGCRGQFELDATGAVVVIAALDTPPDATDGIEPARTLRQRRADRLVEIAGHALLTEAETHDGEPDGSRALSRPTVDVVIDLPTLLGADFDLDDHRTPDGDVDWDSIRTELALTGATPRSVLSQFFCDATWRTLITAGGSTVLDYTNGRTEITPSQRRAVQRRDRHCQFHGCDRHWSWCDVHHLVERSAGGTNELDNLALVCRRHHTMIHQAGWQLARGPDGRTTTTSP